MNAVLVDLCVANVGLSMIEGRETGRDADTDYRLVFVDVGAAGGLKDDWALQPPLSLYPIVFEPSENRAAALRPEIEEKMGGVVVATALSSRDEKRVFHITAAPGCSSILAPDRKSLSPFSVRHAFETRSTETVTCRRYDEVALALRLPPPDAIKIDVQGFEYEVLLGFGDLLENVLAIEMEAHLYPLYHGQKLLGDMAAFLARYGLHLRRISPVDHFDGFVVEVDAWFTKGPGEIKKLDASRVIKLNCIEKVWGLGGRREVFSSDMFTEKVR